MKYKVRLKRSIKEKKNEWQIFIIQYTRWSYDGEFAEPSKWRHDYVIDVTTCFKNLCGRNKPNVVFRACLNVFIYFEPSKNRVLLPNYSFWFSGSFTSMATPALGIYYTSFFIKDKHWLFCCCLLVNVKCILLSYESSSIHYIRALFILYNI